MVLVLFLSCCCWRVITQSLVALQYNMLRCFKNNFHVFPCPWFGKSTNPPIVKTLGAVCYCSTPAAATKYCGHNHEKAAFFLSLAHYSLANALVFPCLLSLSNIQIFSNIATADAELFLLFSEHLFSDNPISLDYDASIVSKTSILLLCTIYPVKKWKRTQLTLSFKMAASECIFDSCCYQRKA